MRKGVLSAGFFALFLLIFFSLNLFEGVDSYLNNYFVGFNSSLFFYVTYLGDFVFLMFFTLIVVLFLFYQKKKSIGFFYGVSVFSGIVLAYLLREFLQVARPLTSPSISFGFPSMHSFGSAICYWFIGILLWNKNKFFSGLFFALPFLIGFSRIYLGFHWFSDVLAGFTLAASWLFLVFYLKEHKLLKRYF